MEPLLADDPEQVGPYSLLGRLGSGGMGQVYLGRSPAGRLVAVKTVHEGLANDPDFRARFAREAASARSVSGAFTAPVVDADPDRPVPWLATTFLGGMSLSEAVTRHGPLPPPSVRVLAAALAEALVAIHAAGILHRDLKPSNIMLTPDGPKVIDFGIARAVEESRLTQTGAAIGTPGYLAPEQALGQDVTFAADVFSLGAVLVYASTGTGPFGRSRSYELLHRVVHADPALDGVADAEVRALAAACLEKDPARRPTLAEILDRLDDDDALPAPAAGREADGRWPDAAENMAWLPEPVVDDIVWLVRTTPYADEIADWLAEESESADAGPPATEFPVWRPRITIIVFRVLLAAALLATAGVVAYFIDRGADGESASPVAGAVTPSALAAPAAQLSSTAVPSSAAPGRQPKVLPVGASAIGTYRSPIQGAEGVGTIVSLTVRAVRTYQTLPRKDGGFLAPRNGMWVVASVEAVSPKCTRDSFVALAFSPGLPGLENEGLMSGGGLDNPFVMSDGFPDAYFPFPILSFGSPGDPNQPCAILTMGVAGTVLFDVAPGTNSISVVGPSNADEFYWQW